LKKTGDQVPEQKMQITSEPLTITPGRCLHIVHQLHLRQPNVRASPARTEGLFEADVFTPPAPPKDKEPAEKDDSGAGTI
jgi:hypothetical protein